MKKVIYGTLALFIAIMILTAIVAQRTPIHEVKYENAQIVPKSR